MTLTTKCPDGKHRTFKSLEAYQEHVAEWRKELFRNAETINLVAQADRLKGVENV